MPLNSQKRFRLILFTALPVIIVIWLVLMYIGGGYYHESGKFKKMVFWSIVVLLFQFLIADPIKFVIQALIMTFSKKDSTKKAFRYGIPRAKVEQDDIRFFKMRIEWNKARLNYNWRHRDESLNLFYRNTAHDIWLYGRYYMLLIFLVVLLNEPLQYYQADGLQLALSEGRLHYKKHEDLETIEEVYNYVEKVIIQAFHEGMHADKTPIAEVGWMHYEMGKLLGVVRLAQVRLAEKAYGLSLRTFTNEKYMPGWKLPYIEYPYREKYWRIYDPWIPQPMRSDYRWLSSSTREGFLGEYPAKEAYITYLARNKQNSMTVLDYLKAQHWLDNMTAALFIDFVIYSVDANIFALTEISVEFTPFGYVIMHTRVDTALLLLNWDYIGRWYWLVLVLYILQLVQFCKIIILNMWYNSFSTIFNVWNLMDVVIVFTNIMVFVFYAWREKMVAGLIEHFEEAPKLEYIDFRPATFITDSAEVFLALLVCIATIRLWKLLLFARVFRLFVNTLRLGAIDIFWALLNIMVFLIGLTISSYMINGAARTLSHTPISFVHILSFSLGYSERVNPMEKEAEGNNAMGLIIYALVMFSVTLVLANMLVTLVCIHFADAKEEERQRGSPKINFWEFLKVEYDFIWKHVGIFRAKFKRKMKGRLTAQLERTLLEVEHKLGVPTKKKSEDKPAEKAERQANRLRRTRIISDILMCQTEILNRQLEALDLKLDDENDEENKQDEDKKEE